jgi:hypothetical protein
VCGIRATANGKLGFCENKYITKKFVANVKEENGGAPQIALAIAEFLFPLPYDSGTTGGYGPLF